MLMARVQRVPLRSPGIARTWSSAVAPQFR